MMRIFGILCVALLLCAIASCRKERERAPCLEPKSVAIRVQVSRRVDTSIVDSVLGSPVLVPVGGSGALRYTAPSATLQFFPTPQVDSCHYVLYTDSLSALADTLRFHYQRQLRYISDACGYGYNFTLLSAGATGHFIDSVRIRNTSVTNDVNSPAHVQIFLRR